MRHGFSEEIRQSAEFCGLGVKDGHNDKVFDPIKKFCGLEVIRKYNR